MVFFQCVYAYYLSTWLHRDNCGNKNIPSVFFLSSSKPVKKILNQDTIIKEKLYFDEILTNTITRRDFIDQKKLLTWNNNLIKIKKNEELFKEYNFNNIENKLFQTRVFFPSNTISRQSDDIFSFSLTIDFSKYFKLIVYLISL